MPVNVLKNYYKEHILEPLFKRLQYLISHNDEYFME